MSAGQDVYAGVETLLSFTKFACRIDPATRKWRFYDRTVGHGDRGRLGAPARDRARSRSTRTTTSPPSRSAATAPRPPCRSSTAAAGASTPAGTPGLEGTHDQAKSWKNKDEGVVLSSAGAGDPVTMVPDAPFDMDAHEWYLGLLRFTCGRRVGERLPRQRQHRARVRAQGPVAGRAAPHPGDTFEVEGDGKNGGRDNGHRIIGRLYTLSDPDKGIAPDACAKVSLKLGNLELQTKAVDEDARRPLAARRGRARPPRDRAHQLPLAARRARPTRARRATPRRSAQAIVKVEVPTFDRTLPWVPTLRVPTVGFRGTAFTADARSGTAAGSPDGATRPSCGSTGSTPRTSTAPPPW